MTHFDDTDLDRLFGLLGSDLPEDDFDSQLHAALVAEAMPVATGGWRRWGRRAGIGVALAAIPLAAAAAVGSRWVPASPPSEPAAARVELPTPLPTRHRASEGARAHPTDVVPIMKLATAESARAEPRRSHVAPQPQLANHPAEAMDDPRVQPPTAAPDTVPEPTPLDPPRVERVRLVTAPRASNTGTAASTPERVVSSPAASSESRSQPSDAGQHAERERARERRQRDALPARERRQAGPRYAR